MGRYRKSFTEAIEYAEELMKNNNYSVDKAAKNAASVYQENVGQIIDKLNGGKIQHKKAAARVNDNAESTSNDENQKKNSNTRTNKKETIVKNDGVQKTNYEYNGPLDIICLNGNISTINISEKISAVDSSEAKEKIYEKLFNNRLPIFIKESNWNKYLIQK